METLKSTINCSHDNYYLELHLQNEILSIPLTEDKPNEVKGVFNKLIIALKKSPIEFSFQKSDESLYYQIGDEYIKQLNTELAHVRQELEDYGLVDQLVE